MKMLKSEELNRTLFKVKKPEGDSSLTPRIISETASFNDSRINVQHYKDVYYEMALKV